MAPKRSYKKRSYKKRRTIRKLKTTLRRKIQRGGGVVQNEEEMLIRLILNIIPKLIPIILSNLSTFTSILKILIKLSNPAAIVFGGSNKSINRQKQRGGDLNKNLKDNLIEKLTTLQSSFPGQHECIQNLINKINKINTESIQDTSFENLSNDKMKQEQELEQELEQDVKKEVKQEQELEQKVGQETAKSSSDNKGIFQKLNIDNINIINKVKNIIIKSVTNIINKLKSKTDSLFNEIKLGIFDQNDIDCIKRLKDAVLADIKTNVKNYFLNNIFADIKNAMTEYATTGADVVNGMVNGVKQGRIGSKYTEFKDSLGSKVDVLTNRVGSLLNLNR